MTGFEDHAGFTISSSKLQVVEISYKADQFTLENIDEAYFNEALNFKDKETKISSLLQNAFNELLIKKPLKSKSVSFTLPFEFFCTAQIPYDDTLLHSDLMRELKWELSLLYPFISPNDLVIQFYEIEKNILNDLNTALVLAIPRKYLQIIYNFCTSNNLKLKFVDNIHIASEKALAANVNLADKGLTGSVYLTTKYLSVIFTLNGKIIYFKVIQPKDASEVLSHLHKELTSNEMLKMNPGLIEKVYITGDDISNSLTNTLSDSLKIDFIRFNPFDNIKPSPALFDNYCFSEKFNSFSPAAGIAYRLA